MVGAYIYVRGTFGRFWGWLIGFIQYLVLPSTIIGGIISMFRVNLDQLAIFAWLPARWSNLFIDSLGIIVYCIITSFIYFGLKGFRWFINVSGIIKWISTSFLVICAIILVIKNGNIAYQQAINGTKHLHFTISIFNNAFSNLFYFFLGFETFIVIGKNVKNPNKNLGKGIIIVLSLATIFYLIITVLVIGAISQQGPNGNNGWDSNNENYNPNNVIAGIAGLVGIVLLVICTLSIKLNGVMQVAFYAGAMLEPLAKEGYISEKLAKLNQENIAMYGNTINFIITVIVCIIMLIIPDLLGVSFNYNQMLGFTTNITIVVYLFVVAATCVMGYKQKLKINIFEWILFIICLLFLISQFIIFNYNIVYDLIANKGMIVITTIIKFVMFWAFIVIAIIIYFAYYQPKLKQRLKNNAQYQEQLDAQFVPLAVKG